MCLNLNGTLPMRGMGNSRNCAPGLAKNVSSEFRFCGCLLSPSDYRFRKYFVPFVNPGFDTKLSCITIHYDSHFLYVDAKN